MVKAKLKPRGKPSKLTSERQQRICEAIRKGCTQEAAARVGGIGTRTMVRWLEKGKDAPHGEYRRFWHMVQGARADGEEALLERIGGAVNANGDPDWRAAAWLLERRWRNDYSRKAQEDRRAEAEIRRLEAEADLAEAKAQLARDQSKALAHGLLVDLTGDDGHDLTAGVTAKEVAEASPTPISNG